MSLREQLKEFFNSKSSLTLGRQAINEASTIVGTGQGAGGRLNIKDASVALRQANPFRSYCTVLETPSSTVGFVQKTGNAGVAFRDFYPNIGNPNIGTAYWTLPVQIISTAIPVRNAVLEDITDLESAGLLFDLTQELEQAAAQSLVSNNDQGLTAGTALGFTGSSGPTQVSQGFLYNYTVTPTTFTVGQGCRVIGPAIPTSLLGDYLVVAKDATSITLLYPTNPGAYVSGAVSGAPITNWSYGGANGLRGLNQYIDAAVGAAAYGTSGIASANGIHSISTVNQGAGAIAYNDIASLVSALPPQYWGNPTTAFQVHPSTILSLRQLKDSNNLPLFLEVGDDDGAAVGYIFGFPVVPNSYIDAPGVAGRYVIYLGAWQKALTIYDHVESIKLIGYEQTQPGFTNLYAELRLASSVVDPFAVVRLKSV